MTDLFPDIIISMAVLHLQLFLWTSYELRAKLDFDVYLSDGQCHKRNTCMQVGNAATTVDCPLPSTVQISPHLTLLQTRYLSPKLLCPFQVWVLGPHNCWNSPWKVLGLELCIPEVSENWLEKTDAIKKKWWLNQMKQWSKKVSPVVQLIYITCLLSN